MNGGSMVIGATMVLAVVSGVAISAQDKYTLKLPDGVPFSDWKGYREGDTFGSRKAASAQTG